MATNTEILQEIREMRTDFGCRLGNLETSTALINKGMTSLTSKVDEHDKILIVGNGELPLKQMARDTRDKLETHLNEAKDAIKGKIDFSNKTKLLLIGSGISFTVINVGGAILARLIK